MKKSFIFNVDTQFDSGINRLSGILDFNIGSGIEVAAQKAAYSGVTVHNGSATVYYSEKHLFFRQLGILCENYDKSDFEYRDDGFFTEVSMMLDCSRGAVPTVKSIKRMLDYLVLMGYGTALLYTEDTVALEGYPYFGYMRGRYSKDELRELDDYAYEYGIELVPCLECYGHMERYLRWKEAEPIKDTNRILLAREEKTFTFLYELLKQASSCFRTRRVHIGMDEAADMGRGAFLNKHGYVPAFDIFSEYMERLISITDSLGLKPMMWSDMYFRNGSPTHAYYDRETVVPPEAAERIPKNVELIFWHYGEEPYCDGYMLKKHKELNREILYCGGLWSWNAHFPEHNYMMETTSFSLDACRAADVKRAMISLWLDDNSECDIFAALLGLSYFAEKCYNPSLTETEQASRFAAVTGGDWNAFYTMSLYHNRFDKDCDYRDNFHKRFLGKSVFYNDLLEGLEDYELINHPMSKHYTECADNMENYSGGDWNYLYDFAYRIFAYLACKSRIHERLVPAYLAKDRETLYRIANDEIPVLKQQITEIYEAHRDIWHRNYKPFGWRVLDERYGGLIMRCDTAKILLNSYLSGKCDSLPQLEEPRLFAEYFGFKPVSEMVI